MYKVRFYTPPSRISPIKEFLDKSQPSLRAKILRQLRYLEEFGLTSANPNLKKITSSPLWELRILGKDNIRIICISLPEKEVKILHIFAKKKQKIPQKELILVLRRYKEVVDK